MKTLSIDLETFSDVDLNKCGVYRYVQSPAFEILLFGYSADGGEVQTIDLVQGERIPADVIAALTDESVTKWAFNASFERVCLSEYMRREYPGEFSSYSILQDTVGDYLDPSSWEMFDDLVCLYGAAVVSCRCRCCAWTVTAESCQRAKISFGIFVCRANQPRRMAVVRGIFRGMIWKSGNCSKI